MPEEIPRSRRALADALKQALQTTPLSRVTVSGLTTAAGVSRQTFYTQFSDVYDLARWVFYTEVADHIMAHATYEEWADGCLRMMTYMKMHHDETYAVIRSLTLADLERFLYVQLRQMMRAIVSQIGADTTASDEARAFVIDHYTLSVLGHILHWLATDMAEDPYRLVSDIEYILHGSVQESLERFSRLSG